MKEPRAEVIAINIAGTSILKMSTNDSQVEIHAITIKKHEQSICALYKANGHT